MLYCVQHIYGGIAHETHNFIAFVHRYVPVAVSDGAFADDTPTEILEPLEIAEPIDEGIFADNELVNIM